MRVNIMTDNTDVQEVHAGKITDMRIENLLMLVHAERWDEPHLDTLFNEVVADFISRDTPFLIISAAADRDASASAVHIMELLELDFRVIYRTSYEWPVGGFDYMPHAFIAVCITHRKGEASTYWNPARTINQAVIGAVLQYCRELSWENENQGNLNLH
jgi:hypothetical protein